MTPCLGGDSFAMKSMSVGRLGQLNTVFLLQFIFDTKVLKKISFIKEYLDDFGNNTNRSKKWNIFVGLNFLEWNVSHILCLFTFLNEGSYKLLQVFIFAEKSWKSFKHFLLGINFYKTVLTWKTSGRLIFAKWPKFVKFAKISNC